MSSEHVSMYAITLLLNKKVDAANFIKGFRIIKVYCIELFTLTERLYYI